MHGVIVSPSTSRLKVGLDRHFREHHGLYKTPKLHRIDIRPIVHSQDHVTRYAGKALKNWLFTEDDVEHLSERNGFVLERIFVELMRINGLGQEALDEAKKG